MHKDNNPSQQAMRFGAPVKPAGVNDNVADLIAAVKDNDLTKVEQLLLAGSDVNAVNKDGMTPLMFAVINANVKCMRMLFDKKADPKIQDKLGVTALMLTCKDEVPVAVLQEFMKHSKLDSAAVNVQNKRGTNALMWAAAFGALDKIKILIDAGADKSLKDYDDKHTAADWAAHSGNASAYELLTGDKLTTKRKFL